MYYSLSSLLQSTNTIHSYSVSLKVGSLSVVEIFLWNVGKFINRSIHLFLLPQLSMQIYSKDQQGVWEEMQKRAVA